MLLLTMKSITKRWLGCISGGIIYLVIHEGTHLVQAVIANNFEYIRIVGIFGIEIMMKEVPSGIQLALFSGLSGIVTVTVGYVLYFLMPKILEIKKDFIKIILYYSTLVLLILDPIYLSVLHYFVGGGDMNGITKGLGISSLPISIIYGLIAIVNIYLIVKRVYPGYKRNFS